MVGEGRDRGGDAGGVAEGADEVNVQQQFVRQLLHVRALTGTCPRKAGGVGWPRGLVGDLTGGKNYAGGNIEREKITLRVCSSKR